MALAHRTSTNICPLLSTFYCKFTINIAGYKTSNQRNEISKSDVVPIVKASAIDGSFNDVIKFRNEQARRTILVHMNSYNSLVECKKHCEKYGGIKDVFYYPIKAKNEYMMLIEFELDYAVEEIKRTIKPKNGEYISIPSTLLWYRNQFHETEKQNIKNQIPKISMIKRGFSYIPISTILERLYSINSVSKQMRILHTILTITDFDTRLRFYTAHQLELCFSKLLPTISITPFGSSVNGFGQIGCDLDLLCTVNKVGQTLENIDKLLFHAKPFSANERQDQQELLMILGLIMQKFIPGIHDVKRILQARVPIIKFKNEFTNMQCDLSSTNMTALYMSELLFIYGEIDERVRPLVCTIRKWAKFNNVTHDIPGPWITNFSLTLLIMFFLQLKNILPSLNKLKEYTSEKSRVFNMEFILNIKKLQSKRKNNVTLSLLLRDFFEYYSIFDFHTDGICIREGKVKVKPDKSPVYIFNPFEPMLNVSKNINCSQLTHIIEQFREAFVIMNQNENHTVLKLLRINSEHSRLHRTEHHKSKSKNSNINVQSENLEFNKEYLSEVDILDDSHEMKGSIK
ncbi:mitochondrial poly(A) polymerase [Calliopsis andreniformis]|uniref:mitochondrial poly(A) polymerase n=1 Tax=Calliopsis andreniformis TaxID=337506 RepID=UPI003FCE4ED0